MWLSWSLFMSQSLAVVAQPFAFGWCSLGVKVLQELGLFVELGLCVVAVAPNGLKQKKEECMKVWW